MNASDLVPHFRGNIGGALIFENRILVLAKNLVNVGGEWFYEESQAWSGMCFALGECAFGLKENQLTGNGY